MVALTYLSKKVTESQVKQLFNLFTSLNTHEEVSQLVLISILRVWVSKSKRYSNHLVSDFLFEPDPSIQIFISLLSNT